jgi:hypothetical protein
MGLDGHELAMVSNVGGALLLVNRSLPKGWVKGFIHRQPVAAMASLLVLVGFSLPIVVPRLRYMAGLPTNNYFPPGQPGSIGPRYSY